MRWIVIAFISASISLLAQVNTGSISGYVLDPSAKAVPNAPVTLENTGSSLKRSIQTNAVGYYEFDGLPPAGYELSVNAASFAPMTTEAIRIEVDQHARLDLHTTLAARGEQIVVTAQTPATGNDSHELGGVLDQSMINGLPLNERDFLQLALLLPGTAPPVQGSQLSTRGGFAMHADGGREENNNFLLDGVDNNDSDTRGYVLEPSVDAIQEFKTATNGYSAEYGSASAGQVNIITRSGGNIFHGTGYDYLRNRDLDARNFFDGSDLGQILTDIRDYYEASATELGVTLAASSGAPIFADVDRVLLQRALGNLVSNALAHCSAGDSIWLSAQRRDGRIRIEVCDTGSGIPANALSRVFDRFYRADSARSRNSGGAGLGLAIVQQIAFLHGGNVEIASDPETGTTVLVMLPQSEAGGGGLYQATG